MQRSGTGILIVLTFSLAALTGCGGKNSGGGGGEGVKTVSLIPSGNQSIDVGARPGFTASATNALGQTVVASTIQFTVVSGDSNPAPLSISSSGAGCAGTWDSTQTICSPGVSGIALVTATVDGVSSPQTTVYVHQHIDHIEVTPVSPPTNECFSQGQTWQYQAVAYDIHRHDITNSIGPLTWTSSNSSVLTVDNITGLLNNQTQVTAKTPGITQLVASVSGTSSTPMPTPFTTCLVSSIRLQVEGGSGNSFAINNGGSKVIKATVVDTLGATLANPPLVWGSSNPEIADFASTSNATGSNTVSARANQGGADISATCAPPTCNVGVLPGLPVYSSNGNLPNGEPGYGAIAANITSTKPPTYVAWVATTDCGTGPGCTSFTFSVKPGTTPIAGNVSVPRTPNSMMFNQQGGKIFFGSDQGLMSLDTTAGTLSVTPVSVSPTPCNVALCGKVLAVSPAGNRVVVADTLSSPHQIYIYNATAGTSVDLVLPHPSDIPTAAAFSPDDMKVFIVTDSGTLYVYSSVDALALVPVATSAKDVAFSADGSFAFVAGSPAATSVSGYATCNLASVLASAPISGVPFAIQPLPNLQFDHLGRLAQSVLVLDPPKIDIFTVGFEQNTLIEQPANSDHFLCQAPTVQRDDTDFPPRSFDLGQGNFDPLYMRAVGNGSQVIVVGKNIPAVLVVDLNQETTTPIALVNHGLPLAATSSTDGSQVFVAACDAYPNNDPTQPCASGSVHLVNTLNGGDFQQVPYVNLGTDDSMCNSATAPPCFPNLIAIKPQ